MKYFLLVVSSLGMFATGLSAIFRAIDNDPTGSMTWILAFFLNCACFMGCLAAIRENS